MLKLDIFNSISWFLPRFKSSPLNLYKYIIIHKEEEIEEEVYQEINLEIKRKETIQETIREEKSKIKEEREMTITVAQINGKELTDNYIKKS